MVSDYGAIESEILLNSNGRLEKISKFLAMDLYSDQTHFIYELLQNAQDALKRRSLSETEHKFSRKVIFNLYPDRLEMRHFGQLFSKNDIRGISDIFESTKSLDKNQIGRFGIGFKSVYAITESPEVHSGKEHFKIENFLYPRSTIPVETLSDETLFIFPFNQKEKTRTGTFDSIYKRLKELGLRTLLFLDEINQIEWRLNDEYAGIYLRDVEKSQNGILKVHLYGGEEKETDEENWLVFQRAVNSLSSTVEVAYLLGKDEKTKKEIIRAINKATVYAYFATKEETGLHFLIQGHYQTTSSRENVRPNDEINKVLISETAQLLVSSLEYFRSTDQLTAETLEVMPLKSEDFPQDNFFRPLYEEFRQALITLNLLPSVDREYIKADEAKLARGSELIQLLPTSSLRDLFGFSKNYRWLSDDITRDKTPELRRFLMNEIHIDEIDPERFVRQITTEFLSSQSDEWLVNFYEFLKGQPALWRPSYRYSSDEGVLRSKSFIRTQSGEMIAPFDRDGNIQVYLPGSEQTDFPTVKINIVNSAEARKFLIDLGLHEPDVVDEVIKFVLPRYGSGIPVDDESHNLDLKKISIALNTATGAKKEHLLIQLHKTPFVRAFNPGTVQRACKRPVEVYLDDDLLRIYFDANPDAWFYDAFYFRYKQLLEDSGINRHIRMNHWNNRSEYINLDWSNGCHRRGINGFNPDWEVDGLQFAVTHPTISRSKVIWNTILLPNKHLIYGVLEACTRLTFIDSQKTYMGSQAGLLVRQEKWLPDRKGDFHIPSELSLDDLPDDYSRDDELAKQLGMKEVTSREFATEKGIDEDLLNLAIEWIQLDPESFSKTANKIREKPISDTRENEFHYIDTLISTFEKPPEEPQEPDELPLDPTTTIVPDPERRRRKIQESILISVLNELENNQRFRRVPSIIWEKKDNRVRSFLLNEYHGQCQICGFTFLKRNGSPYFEGLYLVSRADAQWVDRPGNVLCLCATCCAKFQHGMVNTEEVVNQILQCKMKKEGGSGHPGIIVDLCNEMVEIRFTERHMMDLQEMIKSSQQNVDESFGCNDIK